MHGFLNDRTSPISMVRAARGGGEPFETVGGFAPNVFGRFAGRPGPPRHPKWKISARSKNHVLKHLLHIERLPLECSVARF